MKLTPEVDETIEKVVEFINEHDVSDLLFFLTTHKQKKIDNDKFLELIRLFHLALDIELYPENFKQLDSTNKS